MVMPTVAHYQVNDQCLGVTQGKQRSLPLCKATSRMVVKLTRFNRISRTFIYPRGLSKTASQIWLQPLVDLDSHSFIS